MQHPITTDTRLAGTVARLYRRLFRPDDPHGWADYHCVEQPDGNFWIHTHGLGRWRLPDLEFTGVPHDMCSHAHQLMFAIIESCRDAGAAHADGDVEGVFSAPGQNFLQLATLRPAPRGDSEHWNTLRIVDWDQPAESGFAARLFASHIAAWAELAGDPVKKEVMCRRALVFFPGHFLEMTAGADIDPRDADLTDLQYRANLSIYLSLVEALFAQGRVTEAIGYLEEAIARCPGWAQAFRGWLVANYRRNDAFINFWHAADISEICARCRPAGMAGSPPEQKATGFGRKKRKPQRARRSA